MVTVVARCSGCNTAILEIRSILMTYILARGDRDNDNSNGQIQNIFYSWVNDQVNVK